MSITKNDPANSSGSLKNNDPANSSGSLKNNDPTNKSPLLADGPSNQNQDAGNHIKTLLFIRYKYRLIIYDIVVPSRGGYRISARGGGQDF